MFTPASALQSRGHGIKARALSCEGMMVPLVPTSHDLLLRPETRISASECSPPPGILRRPEQNPTRSAAARQGFHLAHYGASFAGPRPRALGKKLEPGLRRAVLSSQFARSQFPASTRPFHLALAGRSRSIGGVPYAAAQSGGRRVGRVQGGTIGFRRCEQRPASRLRCTGGRPFVTVHSSPRPVFAID